MIRFAMSQVREKSDAEDIVQKVYLQLWQSHELLRNIESPKHYLIRCVKNGINKFYAQKRNLVEPSEELSPVFISGSFLTQFASKDKIQKVLSHLPTQFRKVLLLHCLEGFTHKEIAKSLGITAENSRKILQRAKAKFIEIYMNLDPDDTPDGIGRRQSGRHKNGDWKEKNRDFGSCDFVNNQIIEDKMRERFPGYCIDEDWIEIQISIGQQLLEEEFNHPNEVDEFLNDSRIKLINMLNSADKTVTMYHQPKPDTEIYCLSIQSEIIDSNTLLELKVEWINTPQIWNNLYFKITDFDVYVSASNYLEQYVKQQIFKKTVVNTKFLLRLESEVFEKVLDNRKIEDLPNLISLYQKPNISLDYSLISDSELVNAGNLCHGNA